MNPLRCLLLLTLFLVSGIAVPSSTASLTIFQTAQPLKVTITGPVDGILTNARSITISGLVTGQASPVTVNGTVVSVARDATFRIQVPLLVEGENQFIVRASNLTQETTVTHSVRRDTTPPILTVKEPQNRFVSEESTINLFASVDDLYPALVTANGQRLGSDHQSFYGRLEDLSEGTHRISFVATDPAGNTTRVIQTVTVDLTPPVISRISPRHQAKITGTTTLIEGQITDSTNVALTINDIPVIPESSGKFSVSVPIGEGTNDFQLDMTDEAGNQSRLELTLIGRDTTNPNPPVVFPVQSPTRLREQTIEGIGEPGAQILISGAGQQVVARAAFRTGLFVANVNLRAGTNVFTLKAKDLAGNTSSSHQISIQSEPALPFPALGQPYRISVATGGTQRGLSETEFPHPFVGLVTDTAGHRIAGVPVEFKVRFGDGQFVGGGSTITTVSNDQGYVVVRYKAGASTGVQFIHASFAGNRETPAVFTPEVFAAVAGETTRVSGIVFDQNLRPLPKVLIRLNGRQTQTGKNGRFELTNVLSGSNQLLEVIGCDQVPLPGRWSNFSYLIDVLPGVNNHLGRPLFLPQLDGGIDVPLDTNNLVTSDIVYSIPDVRGNPQIQVTVKAGTKVTFPPDIHDRRFSVTSISGNRIPVSVEDGRATSLYLAVEPSGTRFDPPLSVILPNLDRCPAHSEVWLMNFDQKAGRYVKGGTGHVSADGKTIISDAGSGLRSGNWYGFPPDVPGRQITVSGHIQVEGNPEFDAKVVVDAEAWVEGTRAVMLIDGIAAPVPGRKIGPGQPPLPQSQTRREIVSTASRLEFRATLTVPERAQKKYEMQR